MFFWLRKGGSKRRQIPFVFGVVALIAGPGSVLAQDDEDDESIEEIVTVGTQIKGAKISGALPVSIVNADDIEAFGIDSGDELLEFLPENGNNFFNEAESISGGVNAARGDVGAFNLRSLGTGNTLVLLNGRRMVNAAQYQTEEVGGSFVPVNTVNSNTIPVFGVDRVEVLRDGASAIYGADAVAGVVNTVLKSDLDGFAVRLRVNEYDNVPASDQNFTLEWGKTLNGGATNIGVFANYFTRDNVNSQDDPRWADADFRDRIPEGSPWEGNTSFRNNSANSIYGQFDIIGGSVPGYTDGSGEFETYPVDDDRCTGGWIIPASGTATCGHADGQGTYRHNLNENRDIRSELERMSVFFYLNHEFDSGIESFTELAAYKYDSSLLRHSAAPFSTVKLRVGADNYYNPWGSGPGRLPEATGLGVPVGGYRLDIDNIRFTELPRIVDNAGDSYRVVQGFRGGLGDWDWESAVTWSRASADDVTHNRPSNTLMQEALLDSTEAAYNPFSGGVNSNIERTLVDVYRKSETDLTMFDVKFSNPALFDMPAGEVGFVIGAEYRKESFVDDRDPRLDGTIQFTDWQGDTFPFVSDVVNSSPTPDSSGKRNVTSLFGEFAIPLFDTVDMQLALRYEDFSDVGNTTVPKIAIGWQIFEPLLFRASWSEGFRAPNLVTINEEIVARQNTRTDWACTYAADFGGDPDQDVIDCRNSTQRIAQGSKDLRPEKSENFSVGFVIEPVENLMLTVDYWTIEKEDTIGLFGEENHTLLDLLFRLEAGNANCGSFTGNAAVNRESTLSPEEAAIYQAAGICPAGNIQFIDDRYQNLDTRTVEGFDLGVYYSFDTGIGDFNIRYVGSFLQKMDQAPGGVASTILAAQEQGIIPANYPVAGFADLIRKDGNQESRQNLSVAWNLRDWGASMTAVRIGDFYQDSLTLSDGTQYEIPAMTTYNARLDYTFSFADKYDLRTRIGVNNLSDERAPLADRYFGFFADSHRDYGRYFYFDVRLSL
jgi:outer membrane receptor protein involved in Fe transport